MRKCVCLNKVEGISIKAWEAVASRSPDILNRSLIEVSSDGKILDQMKEELAKTIFSESVEVEMEKLDFRKEALFCNVVREALFIADDTPGISAKARCQKRLNLINWLDDGVHFGKFPPYCARIKGLSHILYEGLRSSMEGKLYLYDLTKSGTYCARAPSTLCSESFFSSMQDMDPWGQGILTTDGVKKHISDFTTVTAMKMEEDRNIFIKTKKGAANPEPKMCQSSSDQDSLPTVCRCRELKKIECIMPRDHFFDTKDRSRASKSNKLYIPNAPNLHARGEQPIRQQYGYRINESKLLPSQRLGLNFD